MYHYVPRFANILVKVKSRKENDSRRYRPGEHRGDDRRLIRYRRIRRGVGHVRLTYPNVSAGESAPI